MMLLSKLRNAGMVAAVAFLAVFGVVGWNGDAVRQAIGQGMQELTTLTGAEQVPLWSPCTVSCFTKLSTIGSYQRSAALLFSQTVSSGDGTTTGEQVLATYSLPGGTLAVGTRLTIRATFQTGATGNNKTMKVYFGASSISSGAVSDNAKVTIATLYITKTGAATQTVVGELIHDATPVSNVLFSGTDNDANAIVIKATGTNGTGGVANEIYLADFLVSRSGN